MHRIPFVPPARIARLANALLREYQDQNPDFVLPYNLEALVWDHLNEVDGLSLDDETPLGCDPETGDTILGKTVFEERMIYIDPSVKWQPYHRFTLAHEIGHWILHCRPHLPDPNQLSLFEEPAESEAPVEYATYRRTIFSPGDVGFDPEEIQANKFAACLLMPEGDMQREFFRRFDERVVYTKSNVDSVARGVATKATKGLPSLSETFGTSVASMAYRLRDLGLVLEDGGIFKA